MLLIVLLMVSINKNLKFHNIQVADDIPTMNNFIYNEGAFAVGVFAGDNFISAFWGISLLMNSGGIGANGINGRSYDTGYSSFTINVRTSSTSTTFDKRLFTVRQNGAMILCNDVWHITNDNINRFYFAANGTTFICGGGSAATDNVFTVYSPGATGYAII